MSGKEYTCRFCNKQYKRKGYYSNHVLMCEELHKSKYEKEKEKELLESMPSVLDMYKLLQSVIKKNAELEEKVNTLTAYIETKKRRVNILSWLNDNARPEIEYNEWINTLKTFHRHLETVFSKDIVAGFIHMLTDNLPCEDEPNHPIKSFKQKPNTFYIYNDGTWTTLKKSDIDKLFTKMDNYMFSLFSAWKKKNSIRIEKDHHYYENVYVVNLHKVLGGTSSTERQEKNKSKCMHQLSNYLNQDLRNITEYSFSF